MNKNNRIITIAVILVFASIGAYFIISSRINNEYLPNYNLDDFYVIPNKKVGVNEYKAAQVNDEDMVRTYFNTYTMMLFEDINRAYTYVGEKTRKFYPNIMSFRIIAGNLTKNFTELPQIDRYEISNEKDTNNQIIKVSDKTGHIYVFTVEAVMKYTVDFE